MRGSTPAAQAGMLASVATNIGQLVAQRAVQIGMAGFLSGAIVGTGVVASGVLPFLPKPPPPPMVALVDCPDSSKVVARVPSGAAFLVTARSFDGHWVEVYVGEPVDRGWVPANTVRLQAPGDRLAIGSCAQTAAAYPSPPPAATAAPLDTFGPPPSVVGIIVTPEPTALPAGVTPGPAPSRQSTTAPGPTTPHPTPTSAFKTNAPTLPPPTLTPTPTPTPTPIPTPPPDTTSPTVSNLHRDNWCLDGSPGYTTSNIYVTATDPDDAVTLVRVFVRPPGGFIGSWRTMTSIGSNQWKYALTFSNLWAQDNGSYVEYYAAAWDSHGNKSIELYPVNQSIESRTACYLN